MSLALGARLGPYQIQARIGAGGMGEVYRAKDTRLGREVAIKVLLPAFASDQERLLRFEREARTVAQLNHPNIILIHDTGIQDGTPYLVMELLEGQTLRDRLREGALPLRRALEVALQVARGLSAAHEKGLTHRDLKPENIFLAQDDRVKILDFGLAKLRPERSGELDLTQGGEGPILETRVGVVVGTVGYMSPEQVGGRPLDPRSDLFSFGVILWEMISGLRPFQRDTAVETMHAILKVEPDLQAIGTSLPLAVERTLVRCLQKEPRNRFQTAADLAFDLENTSQTSTAVPLGASTPLPRRQRGPIPWKALGAAGLGLGLLGAALWGGMALRPRALPSFQRLTYQNGIVLSARFAGDGQTYVYALQRGNQPSELFVGRVDGMGARPLGVPRGSQILSVSNAGEMALLLPGGTLARATLAGSTPREILVDVLDADWSPDGRELAILRRTEGGRKRLEFPIGNALFETTGGQPILENVRVSPRGDLVAFTHHPAIGKGELCVVDLAGKRRVLVQGTPDTLAWAPDGKSILFTFRLREDRYEVRSVSLSGQQHTIYPILGRLNIQGISPEGRVLLEHSISKQGLMARGEGEASEQDLAWLQTSAMADISQDGKQLLFGELHEGLGSGGAYLRNLAGGDPVRLGDGDPLSLSPDGKWALVVTEDGSWMLLPTGAGTPARLPMEGLRGEWGVFLPDGTGMLLGAVGPKGFGYHRLDFQTWQTKEWCSSPVDSATCLISPDSKRVALGPIKGSLELRNMEGRLLETLPGFLNSDALIQWQADGKGIFVADTRTVPARVYRFDLRSGRRTLWRQLTPPNPEEAHRLGTIAVAPRGNAYAYSYPRVLSSNLYLMEGAF